MHATILLTLTTAAGLSITLNPSGDGLLVGPSSALTSGLAALIREHRSLLINHLLMAAAVHDMVQDRDRCPCSTRGTVRLHDGTWRCDACYGVLCNAAWPPVDPTHATALCRALAIDPAALAEVRA